MANLSKTTDKRDRRFQMKFEGGWVEIYEVQPSPKREGYFFLAYRRKQARRAISLQPIKTIAEMLGLVRTFSAKEYNQSKLRQLIRQATPWD